MLYEDYKLYEKIDTILNNNESTMDSTAESKAWVGGNTGCGVVYGFSTANTSVNFPSHSFFTHPSLTHELSWSAYSPEFYKDKFLQKRFVLNDFAYKKTYSWNCVNFKLNRVCCGGEMAVVLITHQSNMQMFIEYFSGKNSIWKSQIKRDLCFAFSMCFTRVL